MGTTYNIIYQGLDPDQLKSEIDSVLIEVNAALSTYEPGSVISLFNKAYSKYVVNDDAILNHHFIENFELSSRINRESKGAFEPTIMPVVNYWGFGYTGKIKVTNVDSTMISQLITRVGLDKIKRTENKLLKQDTLVELDFSGIAKGYGVDYIAKYIENKDVSNYYVEIGGEVYAEGVNERGQIWRTGISVPSPDATSNDYQEIIEISEKGIATSGNYRNFYESDGQIFSHTINPETGFPERNAILSVTIIAPSCAIADGFSTACMVLGLEKSKNIIRANGEIEGIIIYANENNELTIFDSRT